METSTLHSSVTTSVISNTTAINENTTDALNVTTFTTDLSSPSTWEDTTLSNYENLTSTLNITSEDLITFTFPMRNGAIGLGVFAGFVLIVIIVASITNRNSQKLVYKRSRDLENDDKDPTAFDNIASNDVSIDDPVDLYSHANPVLRRGDYDTVVRHPVDQHSSHMSIACDGTYDHISHVSQICLQDNPRRQNNRGHMTQSAVVVPLKVNPSYDAAASVRDSEFRLEDVPKDPSYTYSTVVKFKTKL